MTKSDLKARIREVIAVAGEGDGGDGNAALEIIAFVLDHDDDADDARTQQMCEEFKIRLRKRGTQ